MAEIKLQNTVQIKPQQFVEACTLEELITLEQIVKSYEFKELKAYRLRVKQKLQKKLARV